MKPQNVQIKYNVDNVKHKAENGLNFILEEIKRTAGITVYFIYKWVSFYKTSTLQFCTCQYELYRAPCDPVRTHLFTRSNENIWNKM